MKDQILKMSIITTINLLENNISGIVKTSFNNLNKLDYRALEKKRNCLLVRYNQERESYHV